MPKRFLAALVIMLASVLTLSGNAEEGGGHASQNPTATAAPKANAEGTGSEFLILGYVEKVGHNSSTRDDYVRLNHLEVRSANGVAADGRLKKPSVNIYATYYGRTKDPLTAFIGHKQGDPGKVYGVNGNEINLKDLKPHQHVQIRGKVHSQLGGHDPQSVFDRVDVILP